MKTKKLNLMIVLISGLFAILCITPLTLDEVEAVSADDMKCVPITSITSYDGIINVQWEEVGNPEGTYIICHYYEEGNTNPDSSYYHEAIWDDNGIRGYDQHLRSIDISSEHLTPGKKYYVRLAAECPVEGGVIGAKYDWKDDQSKIASITVVSGTKRSLSYCTASLEKDTYSYNGMPVKPNIESVTDGHKVLEQGKDYTVTYGNNNAVGRGYAQINGCGHYQGQIMLYFDIAEGAAKTLGKLVLSKYEFVYSGKEVYPGFGVSLTDGTTAKYGTDYTIEYKNNINAGTATVVATGIGDCSGVVTRTYTILPKSIADEGAVEAVIPSAEYAYTGQEIRPSVTVTDIKLNRVLSRDVDYTVTYSNNYGPGTADIELTGVGNYQGTIYKSFRIIEEASPVVVKVGKGKFTSVRAVKKKAILRIGNITNADEYQIAYKKKGGSYKYIYTSSRTKTISRLKSKKYYYFKVRGVYYNEDSSRTYGSWSSVKKVKIK